jgi:hypothetical protein
MKTYILVVLLTVQLPVYAQKDTARFSGWKLTLHVGLTVGGHITKIVDKMSEKGFDQTLNSMFWGTTTNYPIKSQRPSFQLGFENNFAGKWLLKGMLANHYGKVIGFSPRWSEFTTIYFGTTFAVLGGIYSKIQSTRLAVGPALHFTGFQANRESSSFPASSFTKVGFVVEGGVRFPKRKRVFIDLQAQYQYAGKESVGQYTFVTGEGPGTTFGPMRVSFSHLSLTAGIGIRLEKAKVIK